MTHQTGKHQDENFQPIAVIAPSRNPLLFKLRCLVDLQLGTINKFLRPAIAQLKGDVLDVGAGNSPWREYLSGAATYHGVDVGDAADYGMRSNNKAIIYYDGTHMPYSDAAFDAAICVEVLEHVAQPELFLTEIARVLKDKAPLLLTVPWSARRHSPRLSSLHPRTFEIAAGGQRLCRCRDTRARQRYRRHRQQARCDDCPAIAAAAAESSDLVVAFGIIWNSDSLRVPDRSPCVRGVGYGLERRSIRLFCHRHQDGPAPLMPATTTQSPPAAGAAPHKQRCRSLGRPTPVAGNGQSNKARIG